MPLMSLTPKGRISGAGSPNYLDGCYKADLITIGGTKYLAIACFEEQALTIINVNTPTSPSFCDKISGVDFNGVCDVKCVLIGVKTYAFVVSYIDNTFCILDISNPVSISLVATVSGEGSPYYLGGAYAIDVKEMDGTWYAFIASMDDNALTIFDVDDPENPVHVGELVGSGSPTFLGGAHDVEVIERDSDYYALLTGFTDNSFVVVDVTDPSIPAVAAFATGADLGGAHSLCVSGNYALVTAYYDHSLVSIDITDPELPSVVDTLSGKEYPYYLGNASGIAIITLDTDTFALIASLYNDAIMAINVNDFTDLKIANAIIGDGSPYYFGGLHYIIVDDDYVYSVAFNEDVINILQASMTGGYPAMTVTMGGELDALVQASIGEESPMTVTMAGELMSSIVPTVSVDSFLSQIPKPHWQPKFRVSLLDRWNVEHDVTQWVENVGTILWQCQQDYRKDEFTASNCRLVLKNRSEMFDIDKTDNYFATILGRDPDGKHTPVQIRGGYIIDGAEVLTDIFYGLIVDIDVTLADDKVGFDVSCISATLREANCANIGDLWEKQAIGGGNSFGYLSAPINYKNTIISIAKKPGKDGTFPGGFNESGYIRIEDEVIYYGSLTDTGVTACMRGVHGTRAMDHDIGKRVDFVLDDGSDTEGRIFQFPCYPVALESVSGVTTSDGAINIIDDYDSFLIVKASEKKLNAYVDYENGWLEFGGTPTDCTSVQATFKSVPKKISYHGLAKRLLEAKNMDTSEIQPVEMSDYLGRKVSVHYGRITHAYDGNQISVIGGLPCKAIVANDDYFYAAIGGYLVLYDGDRFKRVAFLGDNKSIVRLGIRSFNVFNGFVYGVVRTDNLDSYGRIFEYNGESIDYLTGEVAAYRDYGSASIHYGAQWKGLSVDEDNGCVWFIYHDTTPSSSGIAKVNFDGTGYTKYPVDTDYDKSIDFVDTGDTLEVFYAKPDASHLEYATFTKSTTTYTVRGNVTCNISGVAVYAMDTSYNPDDSKIYTNEMIITGALPNWNGYFKSIVKGSLTKTILDRYPSTYPVKYKLSNYFHGKYSGGVYHNGYAWYVKGTEHAIGADEGDEDNIDGATGHIYRIANNEIEDISGLGMRPPMGSRHLREEVKGIAGFMTVRESEDAIYFICSDETVIYNPTYGYSIGRYASTFQPIIRSADIGGRRMWDVLSELAVISGYELGVTKNGKVFFREREPEQTILTSAISEIATTIPALNTNKFTESGKIQIDVEVITYSGKTENSFTGCVRGTYDSVAVSHPENALVWRIDDVLINLAHSKTLKIVGKSPNWQEIYNYVVVKYGDFQIAFDYKKAGEYWQDCSENKYGKKPLDISNTFLCNDDPYIAESIGWRYYNLFKDRHTLLQSETKWQPQYELGDMLTTRQDYRVLLDYAVSRVRRIEMELGNFYVKMISVVRPSLYKSTVYDYNYG